MGPTGVAAVNVGGSTIHSKVIIPARRCNFKCLTGESARKLCDICSNVKFIIIDEYSMIGCGMLAMIDQRCREGSGKIDDFFESLNIYLFGDIRQLPPVFDSTLYSEIKENDPSVQLKQNGKIAFNSFEAYFVLKKCFRQNDNSFKDLLDRLSVGETTQEDYSLLRKRFKTSVSGNEIKKFDNALHLNAESEDVNEVNTNKIEQLTDSSGNLVPIARIPAINNGRDVHKIIDAEGLFNTLQLSMGVRVMLKSNLWTEKGLANGALGVVEDILFKKTKNLLIIPQR
ncbi:hypothetical protein FOCC_FOCC015276 [Frankliniella occidentalis]|nr:hypothetical protein FOCC_FOCC015276 [Frankliniella occidentalis]